MAYNQFKGEGRVIILKGSYPGAKLGKLERSLRDSYGLAGLMKGTHTFPRGWAIPTYEMVAWQFF